MYFDQASVNVCVCQSSGTTDSNIYLVYMLAGFDLLTYILYETEKIFAEF